MKNILFLFSAVLLSCSMLIAQTTRTVTNTNDNGTGSLRQIINDAVSGDSIIFSENLTGSTVVLSSVLSVNKSLTIKGTGISISGGGTTRIMEITGNSQVEIKQIHFKNGVNAGNGGVLRIISGCTADIQSCLFSENQSQFGHGAALLNEGGTLKVTACTFFLNSATWGSGAAIYNNGGNTILTGNLFYGNPAFMEPKIINVAAGTAVSNGYNISDLTSSVLNHATDNVDDLNAFVNVSTGEPNTSFSGWEALLQIIPEGLAGFPVEDFYGSSRIFPSTAGAMDATDTDPTPVDIIPYPGGSNAYTKLVWNDEFDTDGFPNPEKWSYEKGYVRNDELQYYTEQRTENIGISDGILTITARNDNATIDGAAREITSASIHTQGKGDWKYGRIEIRAKMPVAFKGTWPAIWMLFSEPTYGWWPNSGEIDIMEHVGYDANAVFFSLHAKNYYNGNPSGSSAKTTSTNDNTLSSKFHVYAVEWFPDRIDWYFNSEKKHTVANPNTGNWEDWPFDNNFYLILNLAFGGSWGGAAGVEKDKLPAAYQIDYVRIFQEENDTPTILYNNSLQENSNIRINSSTGKFSFFNSLLSKYKIELINQQGQVVEDIYSGYLDACENTFQISKKHQGIYILKIRGEMLSYNKKIYLNN